MRTNSELKRDASFVVMGDIIYITVFEQQSNLTDSKRMAEINRQRAYDVFDENPDKSYNFLIDISDLKVFSHYPKADREIYNEVMKHKQAKRLAVYGHSTFAELIVNALNKISDKAGSFKYFTDQKEALKWLEEE